MSVLSLGRIIVDGSLYGVGLGMLILFSLYFNPRLWLQDYPPEVRAQVPPLTAIERRHRAIFGILFMLAVIGGLLLVAWRLRAAHGGSLAFGAAWLHSYLVFTMFNLFDTLVVDYLVLTVLRPAWAIVPGTEALLPRYLTVSAHGKAFVRGQVMGSIFCLPFAWLATL